MTNSMMKSGLLRNTRNAALLAAIALACTVSLAEKPDWAGGGKGDKHEQKSHKEHNDRNDRNEPHYSRAEHEPAGKKSGRDARSSDVRVGAYFGDQQRGVVQNYYGSQFKSGHCPPGLAKKNNGCMPPGQAKKYAVGQRLPNDVVYYPVPQSVSLQLGMPPSGYKYVRVASDILLIAVGSSMVIDAIQDLGRF